MHKTLVFIIGLLVSTNATAGIENILVEEQYGDCTVRVTHDATPDSDTGTLVFRSYTVVESVHYPCEVDQKQAEHGLGLAISRYISRKDLKPVTSIFVGKIASFPWVRSAWDIKKKTGTYSPLSHREFSQLVFKPVLSRPFASALNVNGLAISGASCEKLQFHANGAPMNALCWFKIDKH